MEITTKDIKIRELQPNNNQIEGLPRNPRKISKKKLEQLKKSVQDAPEMLRLRELIAVEHDGAFVVIAGNQRLEAAKAIGMDTLPVKVLPADTPVEKLREYAIKDNLPFGEDDWEILSTDWDVTELEEWGMEVPDKWKDTQEATEDDFDADAVVECVCQKYDVWQLGRHRLMCGDSTDQNDVAVLMDGKRADIAFTSPPYGVGLNYNEYQDTFNNTKELVECVLPIMAASTKDYVVLNWGDIVSAREINKTKQPSMFSWLPVYSSILEKCGWNIWAERIWKKPHARCSGIWSASSNRPVSDWEYIFTFANNEPSYNERNNGSHFGIIDSSDDDQTDTLSKHPGAFPVFVPSKVIQTHCANNAIVLDLFGGTGTTLIAAEQLNRTCYMMELDPHYCDIIIARWEKLTGQKAIKL